MNILQKILTYVFPSSRKVKSQYSGELELTVINGRKVLDSAHANYSYGSLQRVLKFAIRQVYSPKMQKVLLLGMGGGSVIKTLKADFGFDGHITAVEMDAVIIRIARDEFGINESRNLTIVNMNAFDYIRNTSQKYDLVIVDLFIDTQVPEVVLSPQFWQNIRKKTLINGYIIFNSMEDDQKLEVIKDEFIRYNFSIDEYHKGTNTILIACNKNG